MKKIELFTFFKVSKILGITAAFLFAGCGSVGSSNAFNHGAVGRVANAPDRAYTFAVLPFAINLPNGDKVGADQIHKFEQFYFASRLAQTLQKSPHVRAAYFSIDQTPAVDYTISGQIKRSNGRHTAVSLSMTDAAGARTSLGSFSIDLGFNDFSMSLDPGSNLWIEPTNAIVAQVAKSGKDVSLNRARGYLGGAGAASPDQIRVADVAAEVERENILVPMSKAAVDRAAAVSPVYVTWQRERTRAIQELGAASAQATVSGVFAVASAAGAAMASASGNTLQAQNLENQAGRYADSYREAQGQRELAVSQMQNSTSLVNASAKPLNVRLFDKVHTLRGTFAEQLAQFRQIVREKLAKG